MTEMSDILRRVTDLSATGKLQWKSMAMPEHYFMTVGSHFSLTLHKSFGGIFLRVLDQRGDVIDEVNSLRSVHPELEELFCMVRRHALDVPGTLHKLLTELNSLEREPN